MTERVPVAGRGAENAGVMPPTPPKTDSLAPTRTPAPNTVTKPITESPEARLYKWAKEVYVALTGEPRHPKLETVYVELGAAIKNYESFEDNEE